MRLSWLALLFSSFLVAPGASAVPASPTTNAPEVVVTGVSGGAFVAAKGGPRRELRLFDRVVSGSAITVERGAWVCLVATPTGKRWRLEDHTEAVVEAGQVKVVHGHLVELEPLVAPEAIAAIRVDDQGRLRLAGTRVRGGSDLSPNHTVLTELNAVELRFPSIPGAAGYKVLVIDTTGGNAEILSLRVGAAERTVHVPLPSGILRPGRRYLWQVAVEGDARSAAQWPREARFATLGEREAETLESLRRQASGSKATDLTLILAAYEASVGLEAEACRTLESQGLLDSRVAVAINCGTY
jgi:hypothetical protein